MFNVLAVVVKPFEIKPAVPPVPVEIIVKFPAMLQVVPIKLPLSVWPGLFHSALPPIVVGNMGNVPAVAPVTLSKDPLL